MITVARLARGRCLAALLGCGLPLSCGGSEDSGAISTGGSPSGGGGAPGGSGGMAGVGAGAAGAGGGAAGAGGGAAGAGGSGCASGRYVDTLFTEIESTAGIAYGSATKYDGTPQTLLLDLYQPEGDAAAERAAIVWIHGGGFIGGNRSDTHMVDLAKRYAGRGYVTVSIDYRLVTAMQMQQAPAAAILDAEHDARAAVRWLRKNAATYRVDSSRIAMGGGSAGAITSLFVAYDESEGDSGNPGFSSEVSAVVDFWGALYDETPMEAGEAPVIIMHGTEDQTVPFKEGEDLAARAELVGLPYEFHAMQGAGHAAWSYMDQYVGWITPFLCEHLF